jgi:hypothetical protein
MAADVGLQKLWLFEGKRKKYFVFVRYKVQDNFCLTTYLIYLFSYYVVKPPFFYKNKQ